MGYDDGTGYDDMAYDGLGIWLVTWRVAAAVSLAGFPPAPAAPSAPAALDFGEALDFGAGVFGFSFPASSLRASELAQQGPQRDMRD